jgi:hypothetical protein
VRDCMSVRERELVRENVCLCELVSVCVHW